MARRSRLAALALTTAACLVCSSAAAVTAPQPPPTPLWLATQLVPSPEIVHARAFDATSFALRWQATPLLVSYGAQPGVPRVRTFVVEPIVRHSGSTELFVAPEWLHDPGDGAHRLGGRVGLRSHFPLIENGDSLSCSVGAAFARYGRHESERGAVFEAGLYAAFGTIGLQLAYAPQLFGGTTFVTFSLRYF
jgi:hypothetical protein